jgi:hypothetical protein
MPAIDPKLFAEIMRQISQNADKEARHADADATMCTLLNELGYSEGVKIFQDMDKWYA